MRVRSPLADIDFNVGRLRLQGRDLVVESDPDSSLETTLFVSPADAWLTLKRCLFSGAFWRFMLTLPWRGARSANVAQNADEWTRRRSRTGLNKPW